MKGLRRPVRQINRCQEGEPKRVQQQNQWQCEFPVYPPSLKKSLPAAQSFTVPLPQRRLKKHPLKQLPIAAGRVGFGKNRIRVGCVGHGRGLFGKQLGNPAPSPLSPLVQAKQDKSEDGYNPTDVGIDSSQHLADAQGTGAAVNPAAGCSFHIVQ